MLYLKAVFSWVFILIWTDWPSNTWDISRGCWVHLCLVFEFLRYMVVNYTPIRIGRDKIWSHPVFSCLQPCCCSSGFVLPYIKYRSYLRYGLRWKYHCSLYFEEEEERGWCISDLIQTETQWCFCSLIYMKEIFKKCPLPFFNKKVTFPFSFNLSPAGKMLILTKVDRMNQTKQWCRRTVQIDVPVNMGKLQLTKVVARSSSLDLSLL